MSSDLLNRSRYALLTGDLSQAERLCSKLIEKDPDNTSALLLLGGIYIRESKLQSAQKVFEDLAQSEPDNADAWINAALVYLKRGKLKTALSAAQKAYRLAEDRTDIIFNIGNIHRQLGELAKAEQIYRLAIQKEPDFVSTYNNLALLLSDAGKTDEAETVLKQGLAVDQNNPGLHFNLANLYRLKGETGKAADEYRTALKIDPGWEECLLNLGDLTRKENPDEAARIYRKVMDLSPESPDAKCRIGEITFDKGNKEEAEVIFSKLLTETPLYTPAAVNLAAVYFADRKPHDAEKLLREYQVNDPNNLELRLLLGNILLETGKYNEASTNIRFVLDRNQNESRAWFALARQFSLSGKKDRALNTYRKGLTLAPEAHEARLQFALLLKSLNKIDGAITECEYIYKKNPEEFAPALLLAELYIEKGLFKKAVNILEPLVSAAPEDIKLLQMFAETAKQAGLTDKALQAAEKLAAARNDEDSDFNLDQLNENLKLYDEMAVDYAREYGNNWNKNLKALAGIIGPKPKDHEEGSFIFDGLQDIAGEYVPILDVGGIDPVILFDEEEEILTLTDEDEFFPMEEDEKDPPVEEIEKHEISGIPAAPPPATPMPAMPMPAMPMPATPMPATPMPAMPMPAMPMPAAPVSQPSPPINFTNPLTIRLETPPLIVQQAPEPVPEPEIEEPPLEEEELVEVETPEKEEEAPDNLFSYLDNLTKFLPKEKRSEYNLSDIRLKLAALKAKMSGDPGLISRIQTTNRVTETAVEQEKPVKLTKTKIGNTLNFMTGLTAALPDSMIAESLGNKLKSILNRLESPTGEQKDEKSD